MNNFEEAVWCEWLFWSRLNHQTSVIFHYSSIWAWVGGWEKPMCFEKLHNSDFISFSPVYDYSCFTQTKVQENKKKKKKEYLHFCNCDLCDWIILPKIWEAIKNRQIIMCCLLHVSVTYVQANNGVVDEIKMWLHSWGWVRFCSWNIRKISHWNLQLLYMLSI